MYGQRNAMLACMVQEVQMLWLKAQGSILLQASPQAACKAVWLTDRSMSCRYLLCEGGNDAVNHMLSVPSRAALQHVIAIAPAVAGSMDISIVTLSAKTLKTSAAATSCKSSCTGSCVSGKAPSSPQVLLISKTLMRVRAGA